MKTILVVDDMPICREPIAAALRLKGYTALCAADGQEALDILASRSVDLILLDVAMPNVDGLMFLSIIRSKPQWKHIPVVLLTAVTEKDAVTWAQRLGVHDYLLKSQFSLDDLRARVRKLLGDTGPEHAPVAPPGPAAAAPAALTGRPPVRTGATPPSAPAKATPAPPGPAPLPAPPPAAPAPASRLPMQRVTREDAIRRIESLAQTRTLAGVVAEVIALCSSPRADLADVVTCLKHDPVLSARVLQVANSAAFTTGKPQINTLDEAARNIGFGNVRKIASAVGIFEALPPDSADGFNSLRCWQHGFATAALMDRLHGDSDTVPPGLAYIVGLCHDLGEIVLRQHFGKEFAFLCDLAARAGQSTLQVWNAVFGLSHQDLLCLILSRLGLPAAIVTPIQEFHSGQAPSRSPSRGHNHSLLGRALHLCHTYAHGLLLAPAADARVEPFTVLDCRNAMQTDQIPVIDGDELRSEVILATHMLARLPASEEQRLSQPLLPQADLPLLYLRHGGFSRFDPLHAALERLAHPQQASALPSTAEQLAATRAWVLAVPKHDTAGLTCNDLYAILGPARRTDLPILYLTGAGDLRPDPRLPGLRVARYPVALSDLAAFITCADQRVAAAA